MNWLRWVSGRYRVGDDPLRTLRRIELVALLLGLLLCLQLAYGAFALMTLAAPEPVAPAADSFQVPPVVAPAVVAAAGRNEILSRPLFWSDRRPVEQAVTLADKGGKAGSLPGELSDVKLLGLFGSGKQAGIIALVQDQKRRILLGDTVQGWIIESITPFALVLSNGERSETLVLQQGTVTASSARAAAAAAGEANAPAGAAGASGQKLRKRAAGVPGQKLSKRAAGVAAGEPPAGAVAAPAAPAEAEAERTLGLGPGDKGK